MSGSSNEQEERASVLAYVAANLRRFRKAARMSQSALAEASGISRRMIVALEGGDTNVSLSSLDRLAHGLNVTFVDMVRDPGDPSGEPKETLLWRGRGPGSKAVLMGEAPARREAQLWVWSLEPGERYVAEPDPEGWHEMIFVIEGTVRLELATQVRVLAANGFAVYSSSQPYAYANEGGTLARFVRNVVS